MEEKEDVDWVYMAERMQDLKLFCKLMVRRIPKEYEIPAQQLDLLSQLALRERQITPMGLSQLMGVNKTVISRTIDALDQKGLIGRTQDEADGRSYAVYLTELGREQLHGMYSYYLGPVYQLRRKIGEDDFFQLMGLLRKASSLMGGE